MSDEKKEVKKLERERVRIQKQRNKYQEKKRSGKKTRNIENHISSWRIVTFAVVVAAIAGLLAWLQIKHYERGVLDIYAYQQDSYVQLVLDQINLTDDKDDEEIVNNILATMDSSSNIFWTFSKEETLIFVKDIVETNRYKGFTNSTYYVSETAEEFIQSLKLNKVIHQSIIINEKRFVASGVIFEYRDREYGLCLLTNESVVLDHNAYLSARVTLGVLLAAVMVTLVLIAVILGQYVDDWKRRYELEHKTNDELRKTVQLLNDRLTKGDMYDTRYMAFKENVLPRFLEGIEKKDGWPLTMAIVSCDDIECRNDFLIKSETLLSQRVIRFILDEKHVLLLGVTCPSNAMRKSVKALLSSKVVLLGMMTVAEKPRLSMQEVYKNFYEQVFQYGE